MAAKAKKIYEDFIQSEGPREVSDSLFFNKKQKELIILYHTL